MSLLDVLAQLLQVFVDLIPRFATRPDATEVLVVDAMCTGVQVIRNRPVFVWPLLDHTEYWSVIERPVDLDIQSITTADEVSIAVSGEFSYQVFDPLLVRRYWSSEEHDAAILMVVRSAVERHHASYNWSHLQDKEPADVVDEARRYLSGRGVFLTYFSIGERVVAPASRLFGVNFPVANG